MGNQFRPRLAGLCKPELKHGNLPGLEVGRQLKPIGQQGLHHETHLVLRWIACRRPCFNGVAVSVHPIRPNGKTRGSADRSAKA